MAALTEDQCIYFDSNGKDLICHATGSARNPFVLIKVSENACIQAHAAHSGDYIAVGDPTCSGQGCLPLNAPCDPLVPCCGGGVCTNGVCTDLCAGVTCTAADACHDAGTCDPQTGICSNPAKPDGATCDDGNACTAADACTGGSCGGTPFSCPSPTAPDDCHVGVCNGDGTCSLGDLPDGTHCCGSLPADRCVGAFGGTCQAGACTAINACGDGFVDLDLGETCDDGNTSDGDGCDAHCQVESFDTTAPVKISGDLSCTTAVANAASKVAVDGSGTVFAVMRCTTAAEVAVSTDRGHTFSDPLDLSTGLVPADPTRPVAQIAVASGPTGVAYVAIMLVTGEVFLRTTQDKGATWSAGVQLGTTVSATAGLSLESFNDDVYVGFRSPTGIAVARNHHRGAGSFDITAVAMAVVFFDLVFDIRRGTLAVCADTPAFHVRVSTDAGASFAPEVNPPGSEFFSDWAIGNGQIFVSGARLMPPDNSTRLFIIPSSAPTTSTAVDGLPSVGAPQTRTVSANAAGDAFVASQLDGGGVQLDRLPAGAGAVVVYTVGTEVWATVQAY